jgi:nitrogen fixation/metabolism regulation signal transduction histidine kinase
MSTLTSAPQSLRQLLLSHELAFLVLVMVTGGIGGAWAYFWQQTSTETLRLTAMQDAAQDIRTLLFRQIQEVALAKLREDPSAQQMYANYYQDIQGRFNLLRQSSTSRAEDYAIQGLQEAYSQLQAQLNGIFEDSYLLNRILRSKILDPHYEDSLMQGFETAFGNFSGLSAQGLQKQRTRSQAWTRYAPVIMPLPVLVALALIWFSRASLARGFVRPMQAVMQGTQSIAAGAVDLRLPAVGVSELADLARGINHMAQELATSRDALVESERQAALGALVPVVAHNIRNPLASIRANAQLLEHTDTREETTEIAREIIEAVDRLGRWVSALVSYLHPLKPQLQPAAPTEIFEAVIRLLKPKWQEKQLQIRYQPWETASEVAVDRDLMEQALYGVLLNAVEASAPKATLTLGVATRGTQVELTILDVAGGIPFIPNPSDLTPGPTTKRFGTGLGIPVIFKVCKAHGWDLSFKVIDNAGTLITLLAPRLM